MLDSDVSNADNHLHVEFYTNEESGDYKGKPFVRIIVPGDKTNIIDQPVREDHKERFPRQWLYFQMKNTDTSVIGTPLQKWNTEFPDDFTRHQLQRVGMGATGLRERARNYISSVNRKESSSELEETKKQLATLTAQMSSLMEKRKPGRPPKEVEA